MERINIGLNSHRRIVYLISCLIYFNKIEYFFQLHVTDSIEAQLEKI